MQERNRFIAPERMGAWVIVAFGTGLLALVMAFAGMYESRIGMALSQVEVIKLNERIRALEQVRAPAPAKPAPAPAAAKQ